MSEKTKAAIPVVIGAMAVALALGSVDDRIVIDVSKQPTPYSADHARVQASDLPATEQPPTF